VVKNTYNAVMSMPTSNAPKLAEVPELSALRPRERFLPEVKIALTYLVFASVWIIASDYFLDHSEITTEKMGMLQSLKGLNFVVVTAVLLFFALRRAFSGWRRAEERRAEVTTEAQERIRELYTHVQTLREEERTRISREIHDELGQLLTGIKLELRMVENRLLKFEDRAVNPLIDKIVEITSMVDSTIVSVQQIASGLRPVTLDSLGLETALEAEARTFSKRTGIPCSLFFQNLSKDLAPEISMTTFRIFQEALTNAARHAEAKEIQVSCTADHGQICLRVRDDGRGIDPAQVEASKSLGVMGMQERARNVGGSVELLRHPDKGTEVVFRAPLRLGKALHSS
jgi:signal transduction histidine kinase